MLCDVLLKIHPKHATDLNKCQQKEAILQKTVTKARVSVLYLITRNHTCQREENGSRHRMIPPAWSNLGCFLGSKEAGMLYQSQFAEFSIAMSQHLDIFLPPRPVPHMFLIWSFPSSLINLGYSRLLDASSFFLWRCTNKFIKWHWPMHEPGVDLCEGVSITVVAENLFFVPSEDGCGSRWRRR